MYLCIINTVRNDVLKGPVQISFYPISCFTEQQFFSTFSIINFAGSSEFIAFAVLCDRCVDYTLRYACLITRAADDARLTRVDRARPNVNVIKMK